MWAPCQEPDHLGLFTEASLTRGPNDAGATKRSNALVHSACSLPPPHPVSYGQSQWEFHGGFIPLTIINFADMAKRETDEVSWDMRNASSP